MKHRRRKKRTKRIISGILLSLFIISMLTVAGAICYVFVTTDKIDTDNIYAHLEQRSYIYDTDEKLIDTLYYNEDRNIASINDIPDNTKNAFIAIEDKTFYKHHGFNFKRMAGAVLSKLLGRSESISGTSTITQQLARNVFLADTKSQRTIKRKTTEMVYAFQLERALSKDEILEAYLNTIYLGYGSYGIDVAAETYFSKDPEDLTLAESAVLAALPQAPDTYSPLKSEATDTTIDIGNGYYADPVVEERRDLVLDLMEEQGYITAKQKKKAMKPIEDILNPAVYKKDSKYTYFKDYLIEQVKNDLMDTFSIDEKEAEKMVYSGGLKIYSTIDPEAQQVILDEFSNDYNFPWNYGEKETQAAMVITEVGTGKIRAMVGGRNASGEKLFNRATSPRQPGSSIKPLSVYSAALQKSFEYEEKGEKFEFTNYDIDRQGVSQWGDYITTNSIVVDEKTIINGEAWPLNASRYYSGRRTFRQAIQQSINTCAVKILYQVGTDYAIDMLEKYGITSVVKDGAVSDVNTAALALGAMTYGISPLEMSLAYGTFPNNGVRNDAICYTKVENAEGDIILSSHEKGTEVLDPGVAWIMTDVLKSVVTNGLGNPASISGVQAGGKTGTTNDQYDIWFSGFTPTYSAALWIGTDDNTEMNTTSATAARLWGVIMNQIPKAKDGEYKEMPDDVVQRGGEYFTEGTEPAYLSVASASPERKSTGSSESSSSSSHGWSYDDEDDDDYEYKDDTDDDVGHWVESKQHYEFYYEDD